MLTTTSATGQAEQAAGLGPPPLVAEAATQELVGTVGGGVYVSPRWFLSVGLSYDNNAAWMIRPGITFRSK